MRLVVEEVYYTTTPAPFVGTLEPYSHQLQTLEAVRAACQSNSTVCLLNTSMTGSGKTLANFAAAILAGTRTCGVYPTNELLLDQYGSLLAWMPETMMGVVDSEGLDGILAEQPHMKSHAHALAWAAGTFAPAAVLSNPDVLYLAMYHLYGQMFSSFARSYGALVFEHLLTNYPVIAFDEFHLYSAKQVANSAFIVGTIKTLALDLPHIFIFSSATPHTHLFPYLDRLGLTPVNVTASPARGGRVVCEEVEVTFLPANLLGWQGSEALGAVLDDILDWADASDPQARGVVIVDSVYEAKCLAARLRNRYAPDQVGEVHGYMDKAERAQALLRRLSVGTTTIDVGVDLVGPKRKDFLVGEARSPAQAMQRIGRLGRRGRERSHITPANRIWLAVPEYVYAYLSRRQQNGATITRKHLGDLLEQAYMGHEDFLPYTRKYSPLEAVAACQRILSDDFSDIRPDKKRKVHLLVPTLYDNALPRDPISGQMREDAADMRYAAYRTQQRTIWKQFGRLVSGSTAQYFLSDLESFRGGLESDLVVALYDEMDAALSLKPVKIYTLPFVLRRTQWKELSKSEFMDLIQRRHPDHAEAWMADLEKARHLLGYLHITGLVSGKANRMAFEINKRVVDGRFRQVIRLEGLSVSAQGGTLRTAQDSIVGTLKKRALNCWMSEANSFALSRAWFLPPLFAMYPLRGVSLGGQSDDWSIAFGLDAFLLDSISQ